MRSHIEQAGYVVCGEAQDGVEGIEVAKQTQPDLILLDLTMPTITGVETASILKRVLPNTPIILFTLHEDFINKELAATMGVDMVVDKTAGIPKLAESIKALLARHTGKASAVRSPEDSANPSVRKDPQAN
jgi:DNA-binding response OmpR family regulator